MYKFLLPLAASIVFPVLTVAANESSEHAQKTLDIYRHIIGIESVKNSENVKRVASFLADELLAAGFPADDVEVLPVGDAAALVATYRGDGSSGKAPILLLGHMDVVEALPSDWKRPPFELTEDATFFYGRGTDDNKFGVSQLTSTFIRLRKQGFVPNRDLIIAFSGDEESTMASTIMLANERPDIAKAEFALNSDAGGGGLDSSGKALSYNVQAAEKTYVTWELTTRNPGGHSSRPAVDNAIYDLADAITRIRNYRFPVRWSDMTLGYFEQIGKQKGGELGEAMVRFAADPGDNSASDRIALEPSYIGATRTTCVATMLRGGHAENALPQSATVTINCRVYPGVPVAEIKAQLAKVVDNDAIEFVELGEATVSPMSELRPDVMAAVSKTVHARYPDVAIIGYMASGATDGMHFRNAGIPTLAISGLFMRPEDNFAHGLNERVPKKAFYDALDHWTVILKELASNAPS